MPTALIITEKAVTDFCGSRVGLTSQQRLRIQLSGVVGSEKIMFPSEHRTGM